VLGQVDRIDATAFDVTAEIGGGHMAEGLHLRPVGLRTS
jgi:hypothetical protein